MTILEIFKVLLRIKHSSKNMSIILGKLFFLRLKRNFVSHWLVLGIDVFLVSCSILLAIGVRANFKLERISGYDVYFALPTIVGVYFISFIIHKSYFGIIRHTSIADIWRILKANTFAVFGLTFVVTAADYFNYYYLEYISISFLIIHFLIATFVLVVSRFIFKTAYYELTESKHSKRKRVLVYGAGKFGMLTYHSLVQSGLYKVCGFIDDNRSIKGKSIEGIPVYSSKEALDRVFLDKRDIVEIIISIQKIKSQRKREIIDLCLALNLSVKTIPPVDQWINGELTAGQIKEVKIEDLLGREAIRLGKGKVKKELEGKVIMITGAAGSIGRELVIQSLYCSCEKLVLVDQSETGLFELEHEIISLMDKVLGSKTNYVVQIADVSNEQAMTEIFAKHSPDILFHAAAYKHVPLMEQNPREALRCNIKGTKTVADLSVKYKVGKFVMVSTDKAVNPTNVMGASKRIAEMYVQSLDMQLKKQGLESTKFITTRFGNVLGSNGSVIPLFKKQIQKGGPITVTHPDITRYFMTIPEACQLVMEAGVMGLGGEIFIFDMGESVKIIDLARKMIKLSGLRPDEDIKIEYSGLREGEKLYEELLNNKETTIATHHPKIMIAQVRNVDHGMLKLELERTIELNYKLTEFEMVAVMKKLVPEFVSNSSKFEVLDSKNVMYQ